MKNKGGSLLSTFVHHRVAANLLMALIILSGLWSLNKLNTQFFPSFALDIVNVRTVWSGASAEDIERAITKPMEQELFTLNGLHRISSTSATNISAITMEFKEGTDIGMAMDEINQQLSLFRQLPIDAETPEVSRVVRYENIARLVITHTDTLEDIRELSYQIRDDLLKSGIAKIDIDGLPDEEVAVEVSQNALQSLDMPLSTLGNKIKNASKDIPAGTVGRSDVSRQIRGLNQQRDISGFKSIVIAANDEGQKVTLSDIASINKQPQQGQVTLFHNGKPAIELRLRRTENSDALDAAKTLENWISENTSQLPPEIKLQVYDESWKLIEDRISVLLINGLGGLVLVVAILFIFLNGRVAFWVSAGIPVSFLATLSIMYLADSSINMISLFGLIMAVGIIVDDAIVVAEHSQERFDNGESPGDAAEKGAQRMFAPVSSSSLTTIAAFLPLMIVGGVMGNIMFEIPLVIICVVLASLVECFLILPAHMRFTFSRAPKKHKQSNLRTKLDNAFLHFKDIIFTPIIKKAINHRNITLAAAIGLFIVSISLVAGGRIAFTFFPTTESKVINANISFTAGTPASRVKEFLDELETSLYVTEKEFAHLVHEESQDKDLIEVVILKHGVSSSGGGTGSRKGDQYGSLFIEIISPDQRDFKIDDFVERWKANTPAAPGLESFILAQRHGGPPGQDIDIRLSGNTPLELKKASQELQQKLLSYPGISAIEDDLPWGQEQLIYQLTPTGDSLGLSIDEIGRQLRIAFDGQLLQIYQDNNDEIEVRLMLATDERKNLSDLYRFNVYTNAGEFVPLMSVAKITSHKGFDALRHSQTHLTVRVSSNVDRTKNNANRIIQNLNESYLPALASKYGMTYSFEGRRAEQKQSQADMKLGSMIALALIYIILAWVFASYAKPLVVMAAIPFGITGAIFGHYIMGTELTILSMFGIIGLSGIVVNDSIILVTVYQELREKGIEVSKAIEQAAKSRLRAVILTSLTTIAGLTPLLFETSVQAQFLIPMAVSITFGLAFATLLVLLVIPALLSYQESMQNKLRMTTSFNAANPKTELE